MRRLYEPHSHELWEQGHRYHALLLDALEGQDADLARQTMRAHMQAAATLMGDQEARVARGFLE